MIDKEWGRRVYRKKERRKAHLSQYKLKFSIMSRYYLSKNYIKNKKHWVREGAGEQTQSYLAPQPISFLLHYASNMSILDI